MAGAQVNPFPYPLVPKGSVSGSSLNNMVFTEVYDRAFFDGTTQDDRIFPPALGWVNDPFDDVTFGRFTQITGDTLAIFAIAGGQATLNVPLGVTRSSYIYEGAAVSPCSQVCVEIDVKARAGVVGGVEQFRMGLIRDVNNYVQARLDMIAATVSIQVKVGGASSFMGSVAMAGWVPPYTLALSMVGNSMCVYRKQAGVWTYITGASCAAAAPPLDFKAENLGLWFGCFGLVANGANNVTWTVDNFKVGRFGGTAGRDWCVVTDEAGTPLVSGATVQTLGTIVDPRGTGCMGLFTFDLKKKTFVQDSLIMVSRGGRVENDLAGNLILYPSGDQRLTISTWGTAPAVPVRCLYKNEPLATQDLTVGSKVVAAMTQLALTELPAGGSQWDPYLVRRSGTWYIAYTASPVAPNLFYPALDSSVDVDLNVWANIGASPATARYEGTRILPINGVPYVVTGGVQDMKYWDLAFTYQGIINLISPGDHVTTQPHAMIFPALGLYWCLTFDQVTWPVGGGVPFAWGSIRLLASPMS